MSDNPHHVTPEEARQMTCPQNRMLCDADKCMAWRWAGIEGEIFGPGGVLFTGEPAHCISGTHGRCGMVPS